MIAVRSGGGRTGAGLLSSVAAVLILSGAGGAGVALVTSFGGVRAAAGLLGLLLAAAVSSRAGLRRSGEGLLLAAVATAALNDVRLASSVTVSDALLVLGVGALAASRPRLDRGVRELLPLLLALALIALGGLLASVAAANPLASVANVGRLAAASVGVTLAMALRAPGRRGSLALVWAWIVSAAVTSTWGLVAHQDVLGRAVGLSTHSNHLALAAVMSLGPGLGLAAGARGWSRYSAASLVVALGVGVLGSGSRAALIGSAAVFVAFLVGYRQAGLPALAGLASGGVLMAARVLDPGPANAVLRLIDADGVGAAASDAERWLLLNAALDRLDLAPLVGSGFEAVLEAHNIYLQVWVGAGVLGLAGLALLAWTAVRRYAEARSFARSGDAMTLVALGLSASWLGYFVVALFQNALSDRYVWVVPALIVATWPHLSHREAR